MNVCVCVCVHIIFCIHGTHMHNTRAYRSESALAFVRVGRSGDSRLNSLKRFVFSILIAMHTL